MVITISPRADDAGTLTPREDDPAHLDLLLERMVHTDPGNSGAFDETLAKLAAAASDHPLKPLSLAGSRLYKDGQDARAAQVFERGSSAATSSNT
jgi:hypothetical protein